MLSMNSYLVNEVSAGTGFHKEQTAEEARLKAIKRFCTEAEPEQRRFPKSNCLRIEMLEVHNNNSDGISISGKFTEGNERIMVTISMDARRTAELAKVFHQHEDHQHVQLGALIEFSYPDGTKVQDRGTARFIMYDNVLIYNTLQGDSYMIYDNESMTNKGMFEFIEKAVYRIEKHMEKEEETSEASESEPASIEQIIDAISKDPSAMANMTMLSMAHDEETRKVLIASIVSSING